MVKRIAAVAVLLCAVTAVQFVFASGSSESGGAQKITITQWAFPFATENEDRAMFQSFFPELHKIAPNVNVNIEFFPWSGRRQRMLTAIAAQTTPDVVYLNDDMKPLFYPNLLDMSKYVSQADLKDFKPSTISESRYKGQLDFLPVLINSVARFVNLDLLKKIGYPESWINEQHTWAQFLQMCQTAKEKGYYCSTMWAGDESIVDALSNYIGQAGGSYYNADLTKSTLNTPQAINAFKYYLEFWDKKYTNPANIDVNETQAEQSEFVQGRSVTVMSQNQAYVQWLKMNPNLHLGLMYALKGEKIASNGTIAGYGSFKFTKNPQAAVAWIKVLTGPTAMATIDESLSFIPPRVSLDTVVGKKINNPLFDRAAENSKWFVPTVPASPVGAAANKLIATAVQKMILHQQTVTEAANEVTKQIDDLLTAYYAKAK